MSDPHQDDDFTPQEKQARFEAVLRAALKTPPMHRSKASSKKTEGAGKSSASAATAKTVPPES
jgi:hypothetical protein